MDHNRAGDPSEVREAARMDLQQEMEGVDFVLVDEFTMTGQNMMGMTNV